MRADGSTIPVEMTMTEAVLPTERLFAAHLRDLTDHRQAVAEAAAQRVRLWLESGDVRAFKVKLGSKAGAEADREMFAAVLAAIPAGMRVSVDANGGWSLATAIEMAAWLAERGVDHLEQPLPRGQEKDLAALRATMRERPTEVLP